MEWRLFLFLAQRRWIWTRKNNFHIKFGPELTKIRGIVWRFQWGSKLLFTKISLEAYFPYSNLNYHISIILLKAMVAILEERFEQVPENMNWRNRKAVNFFFLMARTDSDKQIMICLQICLALNVWFRNSVGSGAQLVSVRFESRRSLNFFRHLFCNCLICSSPERIFFFTKH